MYEVQCECGWSAKGSQDELVGQVQQQVHSMEVTREQALAQIKPAA